MIEILETLNGIFVCTTLSCLVICVKLLRRSDGRLDSTMSEMIEINDGLLKVLRRQDGSIAELTARVAELERRQK